MPKSLLISYAGKMPVEVDFPVEIEAEKKRAQREKREPAFMQSEFVRPGALTLRKNNTALVSEDELKIVKVSLGERMFNRFVTEHGEHNPRSKRPREVEPASESNDDAQAKAEAEAKAALEAEASSGATVTVKPGKSSKKGKGK